LVSSTEGEEYPDTDEGEGYESAYCYTCYRPCVVRESKYHAEKKKKKKEGGD
jgi:hypothetical protein